MKPIHSRTPGLPSRFGLGDLVLGGWGKGRPLLSLPPSLSQRGWVSLSLPLTKGMGLPLAPSHTPMHAADIQVEDPPLSRVWKKTVGYLGFRG